MSDYITIKASTLRTALVTYRTELLDLYVTYPEVYSHDDIAERVAEIDIALFSVEGNVTTVNLIPATCNPNV